MVLLRRPHSDAKGKQNNSDYYEDIFLNKYKSPHRVLKRAAKVQELQISCLQKSSPWPTIAWEENLNVLFWESQTEQTEEPKEQTHFSIIEKIFHLGMDSKEFSKYLKKKHVPFPQKGRSLRECGWCQGFFFT